MNLSAELPQRARPLVRVLLDSALASGIILGIVSVFLIVVWLFGGIRIGSGKLDWAVVSGLAAIASVLATVGAIGLLRFTADQLGLATEQLRNQSIQIESEARDRRMARKPYLRVDVGFVEDRAREVGFVPRPTRHVFTARQFRLTDDVFNLGAAAPRGMFDPCFTLAVWVTNLQDAPVGVAYNIIIELLLGWRDEGGVVQAAPVEIQFTYLEPKQTTAVKIGAVRTAVEWFVAAVQDVSYEDIFATERLIDRHGAQEMLYDLEGVKNDRSATVSKPGIR